MLTPPRPKSPPLNALKAFEAAARLGGFKAAAIELNVTPGAIAQHIKTVETWAGAALFERKSQGVQLTGAGLEVQADFSEAFDALGRAVTKLREASGPTHIRIAVLPSIAQLWLSPLLPRLRALQPDVNISITALDTPPNLSRETYDISLFFREPGTVENERVICGDSIFPVCSTRIAARLGDPSDLSGVLFLHDTAFKEDWNNWLAQAAPEAKINASGPTFSLYSLALQEAINGAGIIIGHEPLVRNALKSGDLVAPFAKKINLSRKLVIETPTVVRDGSLVDQIINILCE
ncbi:MAG: LysR substrate-binding domain-containing protein [Pseudomonadota bacterium]